MSLNIPLVHLHRDISDMKYGLKHIVFLILPLLAGGAASGQAKGSFQVQGLESLSGHSDEIAPVVLRDGILFCSNRKTNPFLTRKNFEGIRLYDLYFAPFDQEGKPGRPVPFTAGLGKNVNIGPAYVTPDGNTLYFTRNLIAGQKLKKNQSNKLGIFTARKNGTSWGDISPVDFNNPSYNVSYPYITADGKYLFFASDMPGGFGKYDIYMCENSGGKWGQPVNLGSNVNSNAAEIHPFLHTSGRIYFASDRNGGMGGLDIFYATPLNGTWSKPVRLDDPINSEADDFAFYAVPGAQEGYFSSNRRGFNDDIYKFATTIIRWSNCDTLRKNSYCYEFIEENALRNDTLNAQFRWEWNFGDGNKADGIIAEHCYAGPGYYDVSLDIINLITGGIEKRQASYELEVTDIEQPVISAPDKVKVDEVISLSAEDTFLPGLKIAKYYWNFGDETATTGVTVSKAFSLPGKYNIQLIVTSEPDGGNVVREVCVCKDIVVEN